MSAPADVAVLLRRLLVDLHGLDARVVPAMGGKGGRRGRVGADEIERGSCCAALCRQLLEDEEGVLVRADEVARLELVDVDKAGDGQVDRLGMGDWGEGGGLVNPTIARTTTRERAAASCQPRRGGTEAQRRLDDDALLFPPVAWSS